MPLGTTFPGIEGVRNFYHAIATALPDLHIEVRSEYDVLGCSIREVVVTGTQQGEFAGVKPLGNKIRIEMALFTPSMRPLASSFPSASITTRLPPYRRCRARRIWRWHKGIDPQRAIR
jgi:hypothetical protein